LGSHYLRHSGSALALLLPYFRLITRPRFLGQQHNSATGLALGQISSVGRLELRDVEAAVRAGRLAVVTFRDGGIGGDALRRHAYDLSDSHGCKIVMIRRKIPRTVPDTYEIFLEPNGRQQMEVLARQLEVIKQKPQGRSVFE
jgi:hypothetical protein